MDGLAAQMSGQPTAQPRQMGRGSGQPQQGGLPSVEEVIALLMQGVDPQKLIEMGIPQELIMQAIQVLEQQLAGQGQNGQAQAAPAPQEQGLAAQSAGMM